MFTVNFSSAFASLFVLLVATQPIRAQDLSLSEKLLFDFPGHLLQLNGWGGGPPETIHIDTVVVRNGSGAIRLERTASDSQGFSVITMRIPQDAQGNQLELKGLLKTKDVTEFAGLWMRQDGRAGPVQFDNMQRQGLKGTTDWTEYSIQLPNDDNGKDLFFGVLMGGEGTLWADDLQLLVDGTPYEEAPKRVSEPTVLDTDTEFDAGSGITIQSLNAQQTENLTVLGKVWGFLKYHHPAIASGAFHWDYELLRVLPAMLEASSDASRNEVLANWLKGIGIPETCDPCAKPPEDIHLLPELEWIQNDQLISSQVAHLLQQTYDNRFAGTEHFYVDLAPGVGNALFKNEEAYQSMKEDDAGFRILALYRMWNMIEYWFPYRNQIDDDWDEVLAAFLPKIVAATERDTYRLELLAFVSTIKDTHINLYGDLDVLPPQGECHLPLQFRFIENKLTVIGYPDETAGHQQV